VPAGTVSLQLGESEPHHYATLAGSCINHWKRRVEGWYLNMAAECFYGINKWPPATERTASTGEH